MAKKAILAIIIIIILAIFAGFFLINGDSVSVYIDGENVTAYSIISPTENVNTDQLNREICDYTFQTMEDSKSDITTLKQGINRICQSYGIDRVNVEIDSVLGEDEIPVIFHVEGTSMVPTLQDGQTVLLEKTKDIHVGDIVVANSSQYGNIIKRVSDIDGSEVYLTSDNKNIEVEEVNGVVYQSKGISTWVDSSDIYGVVVEY